MTRITLLLLISIIKYCFGDVTNTTKNDDKYLRAPTDVLDSYILLMFNDSSDLHKHAEFSQEKDPHEDCIKYRGKWSIEVTNSTPYVNDYSLVLKSKNAYSAIAFGLKQPFKFDSSCLVVQYDYRFPNDHECGGAYVKLLSETINMNIKEFSNTTPFTIMFGPDKCGMDYEIKFLFEYQNPKTGKYERRKFKENDGKYPRFLGDNVTHVNTLMICENNSVQIYKDLRLIKELNLTTDFEPSLGGDIYIVDVNDKKPDDWDDREEIRDPNAVKPPDWDENEPEFITDTEAKKPKNWLDNEPLMVRSDERKPNDWDEEERGEWKQPMVKNYKCKINGCGKWTPPKIRNTKYRGRWVAPLIYNPHYRGSWQPRMIENPEYINESTPYKKLRPFNALGIEVWSQTPGLVFDNFIITNQLTQARVFAMHTWWPKYQVDTKDMPEYQSIFNKTKTNRKPGLSAYIHWLWATIPIGLGLPVLFYIVIVIVKKSNRDPDLAKDKYLLKAFQNLQEKEFVSPFDSSLQKNADNSTQSTNIEDIHDEAINQLFGGPDDKIAAVIRKRNRYKIDMMKLPAGDLR